MQACDYLQNFIADKRARGVPWQHISAMTNTPMPSLQPYMDLEAGYQAAAAREEKKREEAKAAAKAEAKRKAEIRRLQRKLRTNPDAKPEMRVIAAKIADQYGVRYDHVIGRDKDANVIAARQHVMWALMAKHYSTTTIGKFLSGRDHSTVVYGVRSHVQRIMGKPVGEARKRTRSQPQTNTESDA